MVEGSDSDEILVVFTPSGRRGYVESGTSILEAARLLGVDLDSVCGGRGICGRCQVRLGEGNFPKFGVDAKLSHVSEFGATESRYDGVKGLREGCRLGCAAKLYGSMVVDVPEESQLHRQVVRKEAVPVGCEIDPVTRPLYVRVEEARMEDPRGDALRLREAVERDWGLEGVELDVGVLPTLQKVLRKGKWEVTVALRKDKRIVGVYEGFEEELYGIAVDVGTTTLSGHLWSLQDGRLLGTSGMMNPQIRYGEDLMSRVSYGMMNEGGVGQMVEAVQGALRGLVDDLVEKGGIDRCRMVEMVLVGNPVMHHLFLGIDPVELGGAPFALAENESLEVRGLDLGLGMDYRHVYCYIPPCIAGHVGADASGVMLSEGSFLRDEQTLVIDVGTNAELMLGNREKMFACSSPTGPALEGAQISKGQRASVGAIERVRIDRETKHARFSVVGNDKWSDEDGFWEGLGSQGVTGICGSGIIEVIGEMYLSGVLDTHGVIDGDLGVESVEEDGRTYRYCVHRGEGEDDSIYVTQDDVRAIQLAKGAVYAGARLLMEHAGLDRLDRICLAGAFGSHIDVKYAMVLGMIPDADLENVVSIGNAAGTGASMMLLNKGERMVLEGVVRGVEKIETAIEPRFQEFFVDAMKIPNGRDEFENLWKVLEKPEEKGVSKGGERRGARRRRSP